MKIQHNRDSLKPQAQRALLLRCWREQAQWRFAFEDVHTREQHGFASAEAMLRSLQTWLDESTERKGDSVCFTAPNED